MFKMNIKGGITMKILKNLISTTVATLIVLGAVSAGCALAQEQDIAQSNATSPNLEETYDDGFYFDEDGPMVPVPLERCPGNAIYHVVYARSNTDDGQETETVISIRNQKSVACLVCVEWNYGLFSTPPAGISGPFAINPSQTAEFTTANSRHTVEPFNLNSLRNTTQDFEGSADIFVLKCKNPKLAVHGTLVLGIDQRTFMGNSYMDLNIVKPSNGRNRGD
ncbi:hypothetical protein H206_05478 [Candidatus Electrothrix aarhusensis]|uniref:Lipoprotein n=1 Tax=Candidatus Electrothrix aarhusensis TaxID=1859131 RepID=A0A444J4D4_9BACT|nr:hypothetical protein H206_05478 [Candidatus Electrothrix aarhusensis]